MRIIVFVLIIVIISPLIKQRWIGIIQNLLSIRAYFLQFLQKYFHIRILSLIFIHTILQYISFNIYHVLLYVCIWFYLRRYLFLILFIISEYLLISQIWVYLNLLLLYFWLFLLRRFLLILFFWGISNLLGFPLLLKN